MRSVLIVLVTGLILQACGSTPDKAGIEERFVTQILSNDTKIFRFEFKRSDKLRTVVPYDQTGGFSDGRDFYSAEELRNKNARYLRGAAERTLKETGFCREGYHVLGTPLIGYANASMRGECKEAATAEDRQRFQSSPTS